VWAVVGCMATFVEAREALLVVSGEPFVAGSPADALAGAQLGAAEDAEVIVGDKRVRYCMGEVSIQGMGQPPAEGAHKFAETVTLHPGIICYQSTRFVPFL